MIYPQPAVIEDVFGCIVYQPDFDGIIETPVIRHQFSAVIAYKVYGYCLSRASWKKIKRLDLKELYISGNPLEKSAIPAEMLRRNREKQLIIR